MLAQTLEYTLSPVDFYRQVFSSFGWRRLWIRRIVAVLITCYALKLLLSEGFAWTPIVLLAIAAELGRSIVSFFMPFLILILIFRPRFRISIDDTGMTVQCGRGPESNPWPSFDYYGEAYESKHGFAFKCGRGRIDIPKRAFANEQELSTFRTRVAEKLGDRFRPMVD